jgi:hypothetical protein
MQLVLVLVIVAAMCMCTWWNKTIIAPPGLQVYGSFTSIPPRLHLKSAVESFEQQNYPIVKVFANIPSGLNARTRQEYFVPEHLHDHDSVEVIRCREYGPATKLLGCLQRVPCDAWIYVIDDDIRYRSDHLSTLLVEALSHGASAATFSDCSAQSDGPGVCGYRGFIIKRSALEGIIEYFHSLPASCLGVDDRWIGEFLKKKGVHVHKVISLKNQLNTSQGILTTLFDPSSLSYLTTHHVKNKQCTHDIKFSE